jgi:hypothetical protein
MNDLIDDMRRRPPDIGEGRGSAGAVIGVVGCFAVALVLLPLRDHVPNAVMALALVIPVLIAAAIGGRLAGVITAVTAALTFDFLFTHPYLSLRIGSKDDVGTFIVLMIVALIAAEIGVRGRRGGAAARASREELDRLLRVSELSANGAPIEAVVDAVRTELMEMLQLLDCVYEPEPSPRILPRLGPRGALEGSELVAWGDFVLPTGGLEVRVRGRGREFGRLVLYAPDARPASLEARTVAVALADEMGAALAARGSGQHTV